MTVRQLILELAKLEQPNALVHVFDPDLDEWIPVGGLTVDEDAPIIRLYPADDIAEQVWVDREDAQDD